MIHNSIRNTFRYEIFILGTYANKLPDVCISNRKYISQNIISVTKVSCLYVTYLKMHSRSQISIHGFCTKLWNNMDDNNILIVIFCFMRSIINSHLKHYTRQRFENCSAALVVVAAVSWFWFVCVLWVFFFQVCLFFIFYYFCVGFLFVCCCFFVF